MPGHSFTPVSLFNIIELFLQKLYNHNKLLFLGFVLFIIVQLFLNFKQGMVATPFMHFGMYSGPFKVQPEISVTEIIVNGEKLSAEDFSATQWDKIVLPIELYCSQHKRGKTFYHEDIKRLLARFYIPSNEESFYLELSNADFLSAYQKVLSSIIGRDINKIEILRSKYRYLQINDQASYLLINSKDFFEQCN